MKILLKNILTVVILILVLWLFTSCRSSKKENTAEQYSEIARKQNDIENLQKKELYAVIENIIQKVLTEQTNISQKETEYDTDKPVNAETGKPPVKKEKETSFEKKSNQTTNATEQKKLARQESELTEDNSKSEIDKNYSIANKSETNVQRESDIFLKWIGGITLFLVISGLFLYILYKRLKKY